MGGTRADLEKVPVVLRVKHEPFTLTLLKGSCETRGIFGVRGCRDWRSRCLVLPFGVCPLEKPPWLPATCEKIWGRRTFHVDRRKPKHSLLPDLIDF